jgi:hypothetical protein
MAMKRHLQSRHGDQDSYKYLQAYYKLDSSVTDQSVPSIAHAHRNFVLNPDD